MTEHIWKQIDEFECRCSNCGLYRGPPPPFNYAGYVYWIYTSSKLLHIEPSCEEVIIRSVLE